MKYLLITFLLLFSCAMEKEESVEKKLSALKITPINHASIVFKWDKKVIYVDPVGTANSYKALPKADLILITHDHGDHLNNEILKNITKRETEIIAPLEVVKKMTSQLKKQTFILKNGESKKFSQFKINAIAMYNLRKEALHFHPKGRGNGYILEKDNIKVYVSGDTEDIEEMRKLKNIDIAFVCMNLPYTMSVESAAEAVLDFKPKIVYPYHYRGKEGFSDINKFKTLVQAKNPQIKVKIIDWYKK